MADDRQPIDAEARGKVRVWEAMAGRRFDRAIAACESQAVTNWASDLAHKKGIGRARALAHLRRTFDPLAVVEAEEIAGPSPILVYSLISGTMFDLLAPLPGQRALTQDEASAHVAVYYAAFGSLGGNHVHFRGVWAASYSRHSLGRFFQRGGDGGGLDKALHDSHRWLLQAPSRNLSKLLVTRLHLPCDRGYFWANAASYQSKETSAAVLHVRCRSFLGTDQVSDKELAESAPLLRREPDDLPLAATVLHPTVLRAPA